MIINVNKLSKCFEVNFDICGNTIDTGLMTEEELDGVLYEMLVAFYDGYWLLSRKNKEELLSSDFFNALMQDHDEFFRQGE